MKLEKHTCPSCGKVERRDPNKRQWCACNPTVPFRMVPESIERVTAGVGAMIRALAR